jgi:hypothetical protein
LSCQGKKRSRFAIQPSVVLLDFRQKKEAVMFSLSGRLLISALFAAGFVISPLVHAQNKPAAPSITIYKTPT